LLQAGFRDQARTRFTEVETRQAQTQPAFPLLYFAGGLSYCDLLLAESERAAWHAVLGLSRIENKLVLFDACGAVTQRVSKTIGWAKTKGQLLGIGLDNLSFARTALYRALLESSGFQNARFDTDEAIRHLRASGHNDQLPLGLLTRAWLHFLNGEIADSQAELDEAWEIAERGPMRLQMADIHLYRARLFHAVTPYPWESPRADLVAARALIEKCGYWRRKEELEDAEAAAKNWK
jgi:hypothetical protein